MMGDSLWTPEWSLAVIYQCWLCEMILQLDRMIEIVFIYLSSPEKYGIWQQRSLPKVKKKVELFMWGYMLTYNGNIERNNSM